VDEKASETIGEKPPDVNTAVAVVGFLLCFLAGVVLMWGYDQKFKTFVAQPVEAPIPSWSSSKAFEDVGKQLVQGLVGFDVPASMTQGRSVAIQASLGTIYEAIARAFPDTSQPVIEAQKLSAVMSAELVGDDFKVTPLSSTRQAILGPSPTTWKFEVLPTDFGEEHLHLVVNAYLAVNGHPEAAETYTTVRMVQVKVSPRWIVASFIKGYWQWAFATLLVPPATWAWKKLQKKPEDGRLDRDDD
jgi:hypothetical protein